MMSARMRSWPRWTMVFGCVLTALVTAPSVRAQTRDDLIRQAQQQYDNFQSDSALANLQSAVDPTRGPTDSLWALAVHLLAQIHDEAGNPDLASVWLQWGMRLDPTQQVDRLLFIPQVLAQSDSARDYVQSTANLNDSLVETRWEWPAGSAAAESGQIRIDFAGLSSPLTVLIGMRSISEGTVASFQPGSYRIQAAADRYQTVMVTREVLPGVTTVLRFSLRPSVQITVAPPPQPQGVPDTVLPATAETLVTGQLTKLQVGHFGAGLTCGVGFVAGRSLLVTTYDAIRGADTVVARFADGTSASAGIRVAAYDATQNVAVLALPTARRDSLPITDAATANQAAWSLTYSDCAPATDATVTRTPIARVGPPIQFSPAAPAGTKGGTLVDRAGAVLGLVRDSTSAVSGAAVLQVLAEARRRGPVQTLALADVARAQGLAPAVPPPTAPPTQVAASHGKKFPWPIAVLGAVGVAGGAAALLAGGGGGGGGGDGGTGGATKGSILISVPNR